MPSPTASDWRDKIPLAKWGFYDLIVIGGPLLLATLALASCCSLGRWLALLPAAAIFQLLWFFRDPPRTPPSDPQLYLSPADGTIAEITPLDHYEFINGPAVRIGIFLSIFNVHINRAPRSGTVVDTNYQPGQYLNALNPESTLKNENMWIGVEDLTGQRYAVRQISGLIARRIVCELTPGASVQGGAKFGMIKFGSRTELIVPAAATVAVRVGDKVQGGLSVLARL